MAKERFSGVLVPVLTPFKADLRPDTDRFVAICKWMLDHGATGLAPFGTTSEANSMAAEERMELLEAVIDAGVPAARLMPGTGTCNITDNVKLTAHAVKLGCGGVLMLPPFYYKNMGDAGLYANFSETIQRVGSADLQVYLYHIPPQAVTPISLDLIGMLTRDYPDTVVGPQGQFGRLEQHRGRNQDLPRLHRLSGLRIVPAAGPARRRRRLHHRVGQCQPGRDPQGLRQLADRPGRRPAGAHHRGPQDHPGLSDDSGTQAHHRPFQR